MSFGIILLIGYLALSLLVAGAFYTACVMAARVEEAEQKRISRLLGKRLLVINPERTANPPQRLQPHLV
jgi:hypothetical protein